MSDDLYTFGLLSSTEFELFSTTEYERPTKPQRPSYDDASTYYFQKTIAVLSLVAISTLIILIVLQSIFQKDCCQMLNDTQFRHRSGIVLFVLFVMSVMLYWLNILTFMVMMFDMDDLDKSEFDDVHWTSRLSNEIGKWFMILFFIFRLHFVFGATAMPIPLWILLSMAMLSSANWIYAAINCSDVEMEDNVKDTLTYLTSVMSISVDIVLTMLYLRGLFKFLLQSSTYSPRTATTSQCDHENKGERGMSSSVDIIAGMEISQTVPVPPTPSAIRVSQSLLRTVTKNTVIGLVAILSSVVLHGTRITLMAAGIELEDLPYFITALRTADSAVNAWALYLAFGFGSFCYNRVCRLCDKGISECCSKIVKDAVVRRETVS